MPSHVATLFLLPFLVLHTSSLVTYVTNCIYLRYYKIQCASVSWRGSNPHPHPRALPLMIYLSIFPLLGIIS